MPILLTIGHPGNRGQPRSVVLSKNPGKAYLRRRERPPRVHGMATDSWEYGWQWRAACRGEDSGLFFAPNHPETRDEKAVRESRAKAICAACPVRIECLEYALRIRESHGIWGGLNELERRLLIRERERAALRSVG